MDTGHKKAPTFMQDADEGTSFENVQTASVKRHLANDANDEKLLNASIMEMIGHLSKDNKEDYLQHAQPLQKYIDVKDEFDFKRNNYTTTENVDKTPNENVRQLQRELNESGYTDKFGQPLKEDGVYAGKTAYADDNMKADAENKSQRFGNRANLPSRGQTVRETTADTYTVTNNDRFKTANVNNNEYQVQYLTATKDDIQPQMLDNSEVRLASANYDAQLTSNKPDNLKYLPDILYGAWDNAEDSIWKIGAKALDVHGWHLTSDLLYLAASGSGNKYIATEGSYASNLLKKDKGLNKFINDIIWEYGTSKGNKNPDIPTVSYEIPLSNGDLGAALHKVYLDIDANQNPNGTWSANIKATDKFNFTEKENIFKHKGLKNKFLWLANDIAAYDTDWGLLDNVDVEICFKNNY